ncbi:MAG: hypothetical protein LBV39_01995 [Bacteroidales bacterium]|jgi:hypothetical protein|nr:hypothetical protein [Bacteroidales bacterium]
MKYFPKYCPILLMVVLMALMGVSCGSSKKAHGGAYKQSAGMRKINRDSPLILDKDEGYKVDSRGGQQKKADADRAKKDAAKKKEADKTYKEALKRHREIQTKDVQERMEHHLAVTNKENSKEKEFFLKRWFRPSTDVDKVEKRRAKEVEKRMAATRKRADQNNDERTTSSFKGHKRKSAGKANPEDSQLKSAYKEGQTGLSSSEYQENGGGGSYKSGASKVKTSDSAPAGGGGRYKSGASKVKTSDSAPAGGGGKYRQGRGVKPSDF